MIKQNILIITFILIMVIPLCNADSSGGMLIGKLNNSIQLPQECSSCTYINITTITYPDLSQLSVQTSMVKDGTSYYYNFTNTTQIGGYTYCMVGDVDGTDTAVCNDFQITKTGIIASGSQVTIMLISLVVLILVAGFFFMLSYLFKHPGPKIFFMTLSVITIILVIGLVATNTDDFLSQYTGISSIYNSYYIVIIGLASACGIGLMVWLIYFVFTQWNKLRGKEDSDDY